MLCNWQLQKGHCTTSENAFSVFLCMAEFSTIFDLFRGALFISICFYCVVSSVKLFNSIGGKWLGPYNDAMANYLLTGRS